LRKSKLYTAILLLLSLFFSFSAKAKHIIGGEMTYICLSNGTYNFSMDVYRDCGTDGAAFDDPAVISVYRNGQQIDQFQVNLAGPPVDVPAPENPCNSTPDACVQRGSYVFSRNLPASTFSYYVVYQRCCRNNTINNLNDPGAQGATYLVEITPDSYAECNTSATFNDFPPTVICAGQDIDFDHSATDTDAADQLVYKFCSPKLGGGLEGSPGVPGDPNGCNGVAPSDSCPPEYNDVFYAIPTYSASNPMGGDPIVTIDPTTGLISGSPDITGQFVVGVCVEEYRGGVLLNIVRRDFQFNVVSCTPLVTADIAADEVIGGLEFIVNSCGNNTIAFQNQSAQEANIFDFYWEFEPNNDGVVERFTDWDAVVDFVGVGTYQGKLVLNPGEICKDSAEILVNVYPNLQADFSFAYDTCVSGPTTFTDLSFTNADAIVEWEWDFGEGNISTDQNPMHTYALPGDHPVTLTITDNNGCVESTTKVINYFPAPAIIIVEPSTFLGCQPADIFFNNLSTPIDETYDVVWTFGDGSTSSEISPTHFYPDLGTYDISLEITSPLGCFASQSWDSWIKVLPTPDADFSYNPLELNNFESTATFTDLSDDAAEWLWIFDDEGTSTEANPVFTFPDTGLQVVTLIVTHESGCQDSIKKVIDVKPEIRYFLPNAFTPNNDDLNDEFKAAGVFDGINNYSMTIWNRWGEQVFETGDPYDGWNGRKNGVGAVSPNGVYVYVANFTGPRGEPYNLKGFATLIK